MLQSELTKAYRKLAKKWHPDMHKKKVSHLMTEFQFPQDMKCSLLGIPQTSICQITLMPWISLMVPAIFLCLSIERTLLSLKIALMGSSKQFLGPVASISDLYSSKFVRSKHERLPYLLLATHCHFWLMQYYIRDYQSVGRDPREGCGADTGLSPCFPQRGNSNSLIRLGLHKEHNMHKNT